LVAADGAPAAARGGGALGARVGVGVRFFTTST